ELQASAAPLVPHRDVDRLHVLLAALVGASHPPCAPDEPVDVAHETPVAAHVVGGGRCSGVSHGFLLGVPRVRRGLRRVWLCRGGVMAGRSRAGWWSAGVRRWCTLR